jgi:hypothetical protein
MEDEQTVDAELVAAPAKAVEQARPVGQVAVQAAAVAATSFVAGAGIAAIVRGRKGRRVLRRGRKGRRNLPVVASRSFLVDVHLLDPRR